MIATWTETWLGSQTNPHTHRAYGRALTAFAGFVPDLTQATPGAALDWQRRLAADGKAPSTIRSMAAALWSFYQAGIERGLYRNVNPFDPAIVRRPSLPTTAIPQLDARAAVRAILDRANHRTPMGSRGAALFRLWLDADYPPDSLAHLRLRDLTQAVSAGRIPPTAYLAVLEYFTVAGRSDLSPDAFVFPRHDRPNRFRPSSPAGHISPSQVSDTLARLVRRAGFAQDYTLHAFKRSVTISQERISNHAK